MAGLVPAIQPWFGGFSQDADARISIGRYLLVDQLRKRRQVQMSGKT
jgi:hypothetical protein